MFRVAIAGCANVGKTSAFNLLTGKKSKTGNWEGVTIDIESAQMLFAKDVLIFDLPGLNTISRELKAKDQIASRNFLIKENIDLIVNIVNVDSLIRDLQLSVELYELGRPMIVLLSGNTSGIELEFLHLEVIQLDLKKKGIIGHLIKRIKDIVNSARDDRSMKDHCKNIGYELVLENNLINTISSLDNDKYAQVQRAREEFVNKSISDIKSSNHKDFTDTLDRFVMNKFLAIPTFILIICCLLFMTIVGGEFFKTYFEESASLLIIEPLTLALDKIEMPSFITQTFKYGVGAGIKIIASFVPLLSILYILLGIIDESGYMTRASVVIGKIASKIGFSGRSIIPLIIGLGCNVPAIMGTRIIENERQRLFTIIMIPFMSCGARLTIFVLFASAFFQENGVLIICCLYFFSIFLAGTIAWVLQPYFISREKDQDIQILPKYRIPNFQLIFKHTLSKIKHFISEAGQTIIMISVILYLLSAVPANFFNTKLDTLEDSIDKNSILVEISKKLTYIFHPIGISDENWPATVSLITGVIAKEVVASTLITLYDIQESEKISPRVLVRKYFENDANAFSYILFVLIYFPCITVFSVMKKETSTKIAVSSSIFYTFLAYGVAASFHKISTYVNNSIALSLVILMAIIFFIGYIGRKYTIYVQTQ